GPVHGAEVTLSASAFLYDGLTCGVQNRSFVLQTGTSGTYRFDHVLVGPMSVSAQHPFTQAVTGARSLLAKDGEQKTIDLQLADNRAGILSGAVFMPDGATPAPAGTEVTALGPLPDVSVTTDDAGRFHFTRILPAGSYQLTARDAVSGGVVRETLYLQRAVDVAVVLRLKGRGEVRVRVVDGNDDPVER